MAHLGSLGHESSAFKGGFPPSAFEDSSLPDQNVVLIDAKYINPDPDQPRQYFDPQGLEDLAQSIRTYGIIQPIVVVREADGTYRIIAGERRWRAALMAGLQRIPCLVRSTAEHVPLEIALVENIQRQQLNPMEEARALRRLVEEVGWTQDELGSRLGKDRTTIANLLRLLTLPESIQLDLETQKLTVGHAKVILSLDSEELQLLLRDQIIARALSVRQAEVQARKLREDSAESRRLADAVPASLRTLCDQFKGHLGTKVRITGSAEQGKIEISFFSAEDLERIADLVLGGNLDAILKSDP